MKILKWILGLLAGLAGAVALFAGGKSKQKVKEIKKDIKKSEKKTKEIECVYRDTGQRELCDLCNKKKHPDYCLCRDITKSKYLKSYLVSNMFKAIGIKRDEANRVPIIILFCLLINIFFSVKGSNTKPINIKRFF